MSQTIREGRPDATPHGEAPAPQTSLRGLSRRGFLRVACGLGLAALAAPVTGALARPSASQSTLDALADAQAQLDAAQAELDRLGDEYEKLAAQLSGTMGKIEDVNGQIADTEAEIEKKERELQEKKELLAARVNANYKAGDTNFLEVLMASSSFEELTSNIYYMNKVTQADVALIDEVTAAKQALDNTKAQLESQKAQLEDLKASQASDLEAMQAKQVETQNMLAGLSSEVQELMAQRDAEIMASAKAEQEERERAEAARAAAAASSSQAASAATALAGSGGSASGKGAAIVAACGRVPSPGAGYCAMWVSQVYQAAGCGYPGGNAVDQYYSFCTSSNRSAIQPGMLVAVPSHPHTVAGRIYGHVGIYVGGGMVMDNIGYIRTIGLDSWISYYQAGGVTARWGFA